MPQALIKMGYLDEKYRPLAIGIEVVTLGYLSTNRMIPDRINSPIILGVLYAGYTGWAMN